MFKPITRLGIGLCLLVAAIQANASDAADREMRFRVLLDDSEIGLHRFHVRREGGREVVDISAEFDITFLAISFYSYEHDNRETWRDGCLESIRSSTDDNGDEFSVRGQVRGARFELVTRDGPRVLDSDCVMTFAYWNREFLAQPRLLNAQNGEYLPVQVSVAGRETLRLGDENLVADRYRVINPEHDIDISVWYAADSGRWLSLESRVEGGRVIRYLPLAQDDAPAAWAGKPDVAGLSAPERR